MEPPLDSQQDCPPTAKPEPDPKSDPEPGPPLLGPPQPRYSIAAVSKLTGISCHTLRVWERRYGFPVPAAIYIGTPSLRPDAGAVALPTIRPQSLEQAADRRADLAPLLPMFSNRENPRYYRVVP